MSSYQDTVRHVYTDNYMLTSTIIAPKFLNRNLKKPWLLVKSVQYLPWVENLKAGDKAESQQALPAEVWLGGLHAGLHPPQE